MKNISILVFCLAVFQLSSEGVSAHQRDSVQCTCNQNDYSPAGVMLGMRHLKGMSMFSYNYMNMQMKNNQSGTTPVSNMMIYNDYLMAPTSMNMNMHMLMGMYGLSDRVTLMGMLTYDELKMKMIGLPGETMIMHPDGSMTFTPSTTSQAMESTSSGLSDTKLFALWSFYVHRGNVLIVSGGVSLPTGSIQQMGTQNDMYYKRRFPYMMQMGSGTVDLMPGLTYLHNNNRNFEFSAQATSVLRTYSNSLGYRLENEFSLNTWASYQLFGSLAPSLRLEGTSSEAIQGYDPQLYRVLEPDAAPENYGGKEINGYFGVSFYFKSLPFVKNSRILAEYGIPIYQNVNGIQLSSKGTFSAAWRFAF